jgi:hypothetical protein
LSGLTGLSEIDLICFAAAKGDTTHPAGGSPPSPFRAFVTVSLLLKHAQTIWGVTHRVPPPRSLQSNAAEPQPLLPAPRARTRQSDSVSSCPLAATVATAHATASEAWGDLQTMRAMQQLHRATTLAFCSGFVARNISLLLLQLRLRACEVRFLGALVKAHGGDRQRLLLLHREGPRAEEGVRKRARAHATRGALAFSRLRRCAAVSARWRRARASASASSVLLVLSWLTICLRIATYSDPSRACGGNGTGER